MNDFPSISEDENWLGLNKSRDELLQKKFLFVYLWSISCGYCKEIIPDILNFHKRNKKDFTLLSIHVPMGDQDLDNLIIQDISDKLGIEGPLLLDNHHKWIIRFGSDFLPSFYVYNQLGKLVNYKIGCENMELFLNSNV